jgi:hypothetical protein
MQAIKGDTMLTARGYLFLVFVLIVMAFILKGFIV